MRIQKIPSRGVLKTFFFLVTLRITEGCTDLPHVNLHGLTVIKGITVLKIFIWVGISSDIV